MEKGATKKVIRKHAALCAAKQRLKKAIEVLTTISVNKNQDESNESVTKENESEEK